MLFRSTRFLFLPLTIERETRWWERGRYVQVLAARDNDGLPPWGWRTWKWAEQAAEAAVSGEQPPEGWMPRTRGLIKGEDYPFSP